MQLLEWHANVSDTDWTAGNKCNKGYTRYLNTTTTFDAWSKGPSSGINIRAYSSVAYTYVCTLIKKQLIFVLIKNVSLHAQIVIMFLKTLYVEFLKSLNFSAALYT